MSYQTKSLVIVGLVLVLPRSWISRGEAKTAAGGGVLEVGTDEMHAGFEVFQQDIRENPCRCRDTGLQTDDANGAGDRIVHDHGKATVNGRPWPLAGYGLYESPFIKSRFDSGVIDIICTGHTLRLDFRGKTPVLLRFGRGK